MRPAPLFDTIVIAGVGLIGGSIGLGIRQRFLANKVIGLDQNPKALEAALGMGVIDEAQFNPGKWLSAANLVILASPATTIISSAESLQPFLNPNTIVMDVGSVKSNIVKQANKLGLNFVGTHPMTGSEKGEVQNASAALLENALWVITPNNATTSTVLEPTRNFIERLGAQLIEIDPETHDKLVAAISHLPYISSLALTKTIATDEHSHKMMLLAAGGFRDITRVASGSPRMSRDMVVENKVQLKKALSTFKKHLQVLEELLDKPEEMLSSAQNAKNTRDSIPIVKRSLLPRNFEINIAVPDKPGHLGRITTALGNAKINIRDIAVLDIREEGGALRINFNNEEELEKATNILKTLNYEVRCTN